MTAKEICNYILCVMGIACIAAMVMYAHSQGHNGVVMASGCSAIVGIVGYKFGIARAFHKDKKK